MMGDPKFVVEFIRNFTIESVELYLRRELSSSSISPEISFGGFSTAADEIVSLSQRTTSRELLVLALGLELTASDFGHASWKAEACCDSHLSLVQGAVEANPGPMVINTVLPPLFGHSGLSGRQGYVSHAALVEELNLEIRKLADRRPGKAILVDWTAFARELGERRTYDYRFWFANGAPFAGAFLSRYASAIATVVRALAGKSKKLLILDCDETLWGGIVGEVGLEGIQLSPDTLPGAYYLAFQRSILDLAARGVILALCSKNNEPDVLDVLDNHQHCLLKREHFAAWRIGWEEKAEGIVGICDELNVGLDSAVFIDDSPRECQLISDALPSVDVLQVPNQRGDLVRLLQRCRLFDTLVVTTEDSDRTQSYRDNRKRKALLGAVSDLSEYKRKLSTRVVARCAHRADLARVTQLVQRTNQFNLTTRRHDPTHLEAMLLDEDVWMAVAEVSDQFGDLGVVGVAIAHRDLEAVRVDTMLMSCRALGRDAELVFAVWFLRKLFDEWHPERILAEYIPSPKNQQVSDFWKRLGFRNADMGGGSSTWYELNVLSSNLKGQIVPDYIQLVEPS
jgi:FkbH-like protein